jgi:hypothetical protein
MNRKYEFQETMVVHSLVRALQMSKGKGVIYPKSMKYVENNLRLRELKRFDLKTEDEVEEEVMLAMEIENEDVDVIHYVLFIMDRDENNTSINMLSGLRRVVENYHDNMDILITMNKKRKHTHPSMRLVRFYTDDVGITANEKDILDYIFSSEKDVNNSTIQSFNHLVRMSGIEMDSKEIFENPFLFIKNMMNSDVLPMKSFKDFLTYHNKSIRNVKINMISDTYCAGNAKQNILNLYRTKMFPAYVLEDMNRLTHNEEDLLMMTNITMQNLGPLRKKVLSNMGFSENFLYENLEECKDNIRWDEIGLKYEDISKFMEAKEEMAEELTYAEGGKAMGMDKEEKKILEEMTDFEVESTMAERMMKENREMKEFMKVKLIKFLKDNKCTMVRDNHNCLSLRNEQSMISFFPRELGMCAHTWMNFFGKERFMTGHFTLDEIKTMMDYKFSLKVATKVDNNIQEVDRETLEEGPLLVIKMTSRPNISTVPTPITNNILSIKLIWYISKVNCSHPAIICQENCDCICKYCNRMKDVNGKWSEMVDAEESESGSDYQITTEDLLINMRKNKVVIEDTDHIITRSRKYSEFCFDIQQSVSNLEMNRVEYTEYTLKREKKKKRMWFQSPVLAISSESLDSNVVTLFCYTLGNLDTVKNAPILSILNRFRSEMDHKGKTIIMLKSEMETPQSGLKYMKVGNMTMKVEVVYKPAFWQMFLRMEVGDKGRLVSDSFKICRDRYSINRGLLKVMRIQDQYGDEISFQDIYNYIPSINDLDTIFRENGWVRNKLFKRKEDTDRENEESMRSLKDFNESLGVSNLIVSLEKMVESGDFANLFGGDNTRSDERVEIKQVEDVDTIMMLQDEAGMNALQEGISMMNFRELVENLRHYEEDQEEEKNRDYYLNERSSLHSILMTLMNKAILMELRFEMSVLLTGWNAVMKNHMTNSFHRKLVNQIAQTYPELSDTSIVIIYNAVIKAMSRKTTIRPFSDIMLDRDSNTRLDDPRFRMVTQVLNKEEDEDDMLEFFAEED